MSGVGGAGAGAAGGSFVGPTVGSSSFMDGGGGGGPLQPQQVAPMSATPGMGGAMAMGPQMGVQQQQQMVNPAGGFAQLGGFQQMHQMPQMPQLPPLSAVSLHVDPAFAARLQASGGDSHSALAVIHQVRAPESRPPATPSLPPAWLLGCPSCLPKSYPVASHMTPPSPPSPPHTPSTY
jgi:hypothetical protein